MADAVLMLMCRHICAARPKSKCVHRLTDRLPTWAGGPFCVTAGTAWIDICWRSADLGHLCLTYASLCLIIILMC